ncbi:MAG: AmmeMemoRadiSam system protein A [Vicinamibacterales bacterium]|nr:AmmeMemoRadiSam system protein A [Vicinamibacterales bacterium]
MMRAPLDHPTRQVLLQCARTAIASTIGVEVEVAGDRGSPPILRAGAFVTLRVRGDLRGCIGYPEGDRLLAEVVEHCAISAAVSDPRFAAVRASEWAFVELEISILGPIERIADISEIEIGRHGLVAELGKRRGLLLPQVAVEWEWDREAFASEACAKAGLPKNAWRTGATLFKFEAEVFGDDT